MRRNMTEEEKQKRIKVREFLKQNPICPFAPTHNFV